jgi:hypothetical protein
VENKESSKKTASELFSRIKNTCNKREMVEQCIKLYHSFSSALAQLMCLNILGAAMEE